ncbi:hypothetical protein [Variovorax sp. 770b2]|uniref:hypothetical protein n=1 Tax=Variovorax sp. 770b2 TaxID=1566271 RepID=UPI0011603642|nr:hypothetical protein [Variovorax sp. 770b2]
MHAAPKGEDMAGALSHQDHALVVFEFGNASPKLQARAMSHLPGDIDMAAIDDWSSKTRQRARVPSSCRVSGKPPQLQRDRSVDAGDGDQPTMGCAMIQRLRLV